MIVTVAANGEYYYGGGGVMNVAQQIQQIADQLQGLQLGHRYWSSSVIPSAWEMKQWEQLQRQRQTQMVVALDPWARNFYRKRHQALVNIRQQNARRAARRLAQAEVKAKALLLRLLDDRQRGEYALSGGFKVTAKSGRVYEINGSGGPITEWDSNGDEVARLCIVGTEFWLPASDVVLSKLLLLKANEEEFNRIAIRTPAPRKVRPIRSRTMRWLCGND